MKVTIPGTHGTSKKVLFIESKDAKNLLEFLFNIIWLYHELLVPTDHIYPKIVLYMRYCDRRSEVYFFSEV